MVRENNARNFKDNESSSMKKGIIEFKGVYTYTMQRFKQYSVFSIPKKGLENRD